MDFHGHINLLDNKIQLPVLSTESSLPSSAPVGRMVFTDKKLYMNVALNTGLPIWVPMTNTVDYFIHEQTSASTTWTITHNLNDTNPVVVIYDDSNSLIIPQSVDTTSDFVTTITLNTAISGRAAILSGDLIPANGAGVLDSFAVTFDLANSSYTGTSLDIQAQESNPTDLAFNDDGTKLITIGSASDAFDEHTLSTPYDITSVSGTVNNILSVSGQDSVPAGFAFNPTGTILFLQGSGTGDALFSYNVSVGFDLSTATYSGNSFATTSEDSAMEDVIFNNDGTKLFTVGRVTRAVYEYDLATPYDITTVSYSGNSFGVISEEAIPRGIEFNSDGTALFLVGEGSDGVFKYDLSTAYDVTSMSYSGDSLSILAQDGTSSGLTFNAAHDKMFVVGRANDTIYEYV